MTFQLLDSFSESAPLHPLNQTNDVDALFAKTVLTGTKKPVLLSVVPKRRIPVPMVVVFRIGAPGDTIPKFDLIEILCYDGDVGNPTLQS